jgi:hypothetical protein
MYRPGKIHVVADALLRLLDIIKPICVCDQTTYANMFYTKLEWLNDVKEFLKIGLIKGTLFVQQK